MTPLLEKTDSMLASWFSKGAISQVKSGDSPATSQSEALATGDKPELEANNSVTSAVVPILEKTDEYLASWGITRSVSNAKSEGGGVLQVSLNCELVPRPLSMSMICDSLDMLASKLLASNLSANVNTLCQQVPIGVPSAIKPNGRSKSSYWSNCRHLVAITGSAL